MQSQDYELSVLACMFDWPETIQAVKDNLTSADFRQPHHSELFDLFVLLDSMQTLDIMHIEERLRGTPRAKYFLDNLFESNIPGGSELVKVYIRGILKESKLRKIDELCVRINMAYGDEKPELLAQLAAMQAEVPDTMTIYRVDRLSREGNVVIHFSKPDADLAETLLPELVSIAVTTHKTKLSKLNWSILSKRKVLIWQADQAGPASLLYDLISRYAEGVRIIRDDKNISISTLEQMGTGGVMNFIREHLYEPVPDNPPPPDENHRPMVPDDNAIILDNEESMPFTCLGFDHGEYYYFSRMFQQVVKLKIEQHTEAHLNQLAELKYWEGMYMGGKTKVDFNGARNHLLQLQRPKGVYSNTRIRGRGAWEDDGRSVLHLGDSLVVNGQESKLSGINSRYIYEAATRLEYYSKGLVQLGNKDAHKFIELCNMLSWEKEIYGTLLAGWCALAPICGALRWRPGAWISGPKGSGKSWCVFNIVRRIVGPISLFVKGVTTEAGIRQRLQNDARPIIHDEAEGKSPESIKRLEAELELVRQSTMDDDGEILKGTTSGKVQRFKIRSMFLFASIGVTAIENADTSRISTLTLRESKGPEHFSQVLRPFWTEVMTDEYCQRFRNRVISAIPVIQQNTAQFTRAVAEHVGDQRVGDQIGALLAGAYLCNSTGNINYDDAMAYVKRQNWEDQAIAQSDENLDERRCLFAIMESTIKIQGTRVCSEMNIGELIQRVASDCQQSMDPDQDTCHKAIQRYGVKVASDGQSFHISYTHKGIGKALEKTPWGRNWHTIIARLPYAVKTQPQHFTGGIKARTVQLPIGYAEGV